MKRLLIEASFPTLKAELTPWQAKVKKAGQLPEPSKLPQGEAGEELQLWWIEQLMIHGQEHEAAQLIDNIVFDENAASLPLLHHAWLWLARMTVFISTADYMLALGSAENTLNVMVQCTSKRSEDFLGILASLLYNLAYVHNKTDDNSRAVKELTKAQKLFERLVKRNNARFSPMLVYSVEASTTIFKSRLKQMNVFAHYQTTTELYTAMLSQKGDRTREALVNLVDSLKNEGDITLQMGNARNAVKYYTKALRYQKKLNEKMGIRDLDLSISLARALLRLVNRRAAAEQLLNSLIPLAQQLQATDQMVEIEQLLNNRSKNSNIMSLLKGIF